MSEGGRSGERRPSGSTGTRLLIALALLGCGKGADKTGAGSGSASGAGLASGAADPAVASSPARDALVAAWKAGKLDPSALVPAKTPVGKDCATGTVNDVDVLVCVYPSTGEAKEAEFAGFQWVGDATGAAQQHGVLLVAAVDRKKKDPNGRTINQLMKLAPK